MFRRKKGDDFKDIIAGCSLEKLEQIVDSLHGVMMKKIREEQKQNHPNVPPWVFDAIHEGSEQVVREMYQENLTEKHVRIDRWIEENRPEAYRWLQDHRDNTQAVLEELEAVCDEIAERVDI